jgi:hypothetical protein
LNAPGAAVVWQPLWPICQLTYSHPLAYIEPKQLQV